VKRGEEFVSSSVFPEVKFGRLSCMVGACISRAVPYMICAVRAV
jgi:hypothetical protein